MAYKRYDHRRMAFPQKLSGRQRDSRLQEDVEILQKMSDHRKSIDLYGGYLGQGRRKPGLAKQYDIDASSQQKMQMPAHFPDGRGIRKGSPLVNFASNSSISTVRTGFSQGSRKRAQSVFRPLQPHDELSETTSFVLGAESSENDLEVLDSIRLHLNEMKKHREKQKMGEEFEEIKERMKQILCQFEEIEDPFDAARLQAPTHYEPEPDHEKSAIQEGIEEILRMYAGVCQEREEVLNEAFESLDPIELDEALHGRKSPLKSEDVEEISSQITALIHETTRKTEKLLKVHSKLKHLRASCVAVQDRPSSQKISIQQKVVEQLKKLHRTHSNKKEKMETWKYAATEIVDLLRSVRQEGASGIERLESEFSHLLEAFHSQSEILEEREVTVKKQKKCIQQHVADNEKLRNDTVLLQDQLDRTKSYLRVAQMKISKLEGTTQSPTGVEIPVTITDDGVHSDPGQTCQLPNVQVDTPATHRPEEKDLNAALETIRNLELQLRSVQEELEASQKQDRELGVALDDGEAESKDMANNYDFSRSAMRIQPGLMVPASKENQAVCTRCKESQSKVHDLLVELNNKRKLVADLTAQLADAHHEIDQLTVEYKRSGDEVADRNPRVAARDVDSNRGHATSGFVNGEQENLEEKLALEERERSHGGQGKSANAERESARILSAQRSLSHGVVAESINTNDEGHNGKTVHHKEVQVGQNDEACSANVIVEMTQTNANFESRTKEEFKDAVENEFSKLTSTIGVFLKLAGKLTQARARLAQKESNETGTEQLPAIAEPLHPDCAEEGIQTGSVPPVNSSQNREIRETGRGFKADGSHRTALGVPGFFPHFQPDTSQESMHRNWTESGFFDEHVSESDGKPATKKDRKNSKWEVLKKSSSHVLRFLHRIGKNKCSYLECKISELISNQTQPDDELIMRELNIFAEHALDLLEIISFCIKRLSLEGVEFKKSVVEDPSILAKMNALWQPLSALPGSVEASASRVVKFNAAKAEPSECLEDGPTPAPPLFPDIAQRPNSAVRQQPPMFTSSNADVPRQARAAEKRRLKLLERHKRLVERLRSSGVSMKQIHAILGIPKKTGTDEDDDEGTPVASLETAPLYDAKTKARLRAVSTIGHAYQGNPEVALAVTGWRSKDQSASASPGQNPIASKKAALAAGTGQRGSGPFGPSAASFPSPGQSSFGISTMPFRLIASGLQSGQGSSSLLRKGVGLPSGNINLNFISNFPLFPDIVDPGVSGSKKKPAFPVLPTKAMPAIASRQGVRPKHYIPGPRLP